MGWLRLVGSLVLQASFAEYRLFYRALLQKTPRILRSLLIARHIFLSEEKDMGWLRLAGSLELQVFFAEYRLFYRALLHKRPLILRSLLIVATPCYIPGMLLSSKSSLCCNFRQAKK